MCQRVCMPLLDTPAKAALPPLDTTGTGTLSPLHSPDNRTLPPLLETQCRGARHQVIIILIELKRPRICHRNFSGMCCIGTVVDLVDESRHDRVSAFHACQRSVKHLLKQPGAANGFIDADRTVLITVLGGQRLSLKAEIRKLFDHVGEEWPF